MSTRLTAEQRDLLRSNPQTLLREQGVTPVQPQRQQGETQVTYRP